MPRLKHLKQLTGSRNCPDKIYIQVWILGYNLIIGRSWTAGKRQVVNSGFVPGELIFRDANGSNLLDC